MLNQHNDRRKRSRVARQNIAFTTMLVYGCYQPLQALDSKMKNVRFFSEINWIHVISLSVNTFKKLVDHAMPRAAPRGKWIATPNNNHGRRARATTTSNAKRAYKIARLYTTRSQCVMLIGKRLLYMVWLICYTVLCVLALLDLVLYNLACIRSDDVQYFQFCIFLGQAGHAMSWVNKECLTISNIRKS